MLIACLAEDGSTIQRYALTRGDRQAFDVAVHHRPDREWHYSGELAPLLDRLAEMAAPAAATGT